tara:strand:+ start:186 stop:305 length:120 start_codon:yes stop_codon:yes gene_type:complete
MDLGVTDRVLPLIEKVREIETTELFMLNTNLTNQIYLEE